MASIVAGAFSPFCRKHQPAREERSKLLRDAAVKTLEATVAAVKDKERERAPEKDRVAHAMRQWTSVRADADLAYVTPPPPVEASLPAAEPAPFPVIEQRVVEMPPPSPSQDTSGGDTATLAEPNPFLIVDFHGAPNFYEILQISPRADTETIHRVYRIMAARFHPDNPVSGDHEVFLKLCEAYEVLSRPEQRLLYDQALRVRETEPIPLFSARIFVDGLDGEAHRRFGMLALLYQRRRTNQGSLGISTLELEMRMALPREHLEFTLWYLRNKGYVQILEQNSDFAITADGVDYVEANSTKNPILRELLTAGSPGSKPAPAPPPPQSSPAKGRRAKAESRRARREGASVAN